MGNSTSQEAQLPYKTSKISELGVSSEVKEHSLAQKAPISDSSNRQVFVTHNIIGLLICHFVSGMLSHFAILESV